MTAQFTICLLTELSLGPQIGTKSSKDLMTEWFGDGVDGSWFPYPDKAVSPVCETSSEILTGPLAIFNGSAI